MKKKIMSIIAAAAVIASGSPLCANASYTETINSDHTGYTKVDFMCDEKNDIYICDSPYSNDKYKYARESISEMKHSDRIYLKIDDGIDLIEKQNNPSEENEVTNEINALIGDFKTENGNNVKAFINKYNNEFNYYITPYISDDPNEILKLTPNDARSIKELLTKKDIADDMIFSNDVCSPSRGRIDFTHFYFNTRNKTASEQIEENTAIQNQIKKLAEEKKYDITVSGEGGFINITPTTDMPFEEMYDIAKNIKINCEDLVIEQIKEGAVENESFGGVDLLNAVDGDSNCDEQMDMADAVLIMQALANPNKYGLEGTAENHLTKQGQFNADLNGDGLTVGDAQAIQRKLLGLGSDDNHSKPLPTQRIVLSCQSSCALDETLKIDVAMGDMYSYQQEHNGYPTYDTPGHAEYGIYACDSVNYSRIDNENLIINGENSEFKKVYSKEEMKSLDISGKADDYDSYHHETAEIDFSNFKTGDSGNIVVYFLWEYDEENPYNPSSKISGMSKIVGYYVGEKGVAIGADAEDAQSRYQSLFDSVSNDENVIRFGYYDEDYNKPLPSARIALKCDSFCPLGEKLTVDVAKGDGAFHPQDYDSDRIYEYSIYPSENFNAITDEKLIVNGENGSYKKEYVGEEMQVFDIDGKYTDYDAYNHETAVIDFKNYEVGSSGCITFSFKAVFTDDAATPSTSGMMQNMYFYVGEKGISISNLSVENAIEDYEAAYGSDDNKVLFGYYDANYSKPLPSARIAMKCNSICSLGGQLTVDVAKGDGSFHPQDYDSNRIYEYSIYPAENFNQINDEKLIVNGEKGSYKKEYSGEEMQVFDIDGKYTDYDAYNHETAVIDFKNYEVGSSGCITFSFKAVFIDDAATPSTSGMMQNMYFYVGEKGISISNFSVENAIEDYQAAYGSTD